MNAPKAQQTLAAIEFWFDFGSNYSYLSAMRIEPRRSFAAFAFCGSRFCSARFFANSASTHSPFVLQKEKGAYVWQDMARQCRKYGLRWTQPSTFPRRGVLRLAHRALRPGRALDRRISAAASWNAILFMTKTSIIKIDVMPILREPRSAGRGYCRAGAIRSDQDAVARANR